MGPNGYNTNTPLSPFTVNYSHNKQHASQQPPPHNQSPQRAQRPRVRRRRPSVLVCSRPRTLRSRQAWPALAGPPSLLLVLLLLSLPSLLCPLFLASLLAFAYILLVSVPYLQREDEPAHAHV